ncbi:MAG: sugar O-acetyltransferase [Clostridiales bacterium]|jgi:acetyltransferase-like isoleucine patch superfamily enzyme|nr:sugar O-acetyltransferase [Clostridiales bacterium]
MTEKEKSALGLLYQPFDGAELVAERAAAREKLFVFNRLSPSEAEKGREILRGLFGKCGKMFTVETPFRCDYGYNIEIGERFFSNYNFIVLDEAKVTFGDDVLIAPNVGIYTAGHPLDFERRAAALEYAYPVTVGDGVWIGAGVQILPGVSIGNGTVIGAGSVVIKDIPAGVLAAGNPCSVIRKITAEDVKKYR